MSPLVTSLWITLIGMSLVFIAILLLWGLMEALMRFTARFAAAEAEEGGEESHEESAGSTPEIMPAAASDQKKRAAVVAVALALALRHPAARTALPAITRNAGSAWQAVNRAGQLNNPPHIARKSRGNVR